MWCASGFRWSKILSYFRTAIILWTFPEKKLAEKREKTFGKLHSVLRFENFNFQWIKIQMKSPLDSVSSRALRINQFNETLF